MTKTGQLLISLITVAILFIVVIFGCEKTPEHTSTLNEDSNALAQKVELNARDAWIPLAIDYPARDSREMEHSLEGGHLGISRRLKLAAKPALVRVPPDVMNVAKGKPVTLTDDSVVLGEPEYMTDGDKRSENYVQFDPQDHSHVTIDLQDAYEIYAVAWWHGFQRPAVYWDVVVQIGKDIDFDDSVILFNNDQDGSLGLGEGTDLNYVETNKGWLAGADGFVGRYVRMYQNWNSLNTTNQYTEVEVYGRLPRKPL